MAVVPCYHVAADGGCDGCVARVDDVGSEGSGNRAMSSRRKGSIAHHCYHHSALFLHAEIYQSDHRYRGEPEPDIGNADATGEEPTLNSIEIHGWLLRLSRFIRKTGENETEIEGVL